jgi:trehalose 6-phosphate phosphatase
MATCTPRQSATRASSQVDEGADLQAIRDGGRSTAKPRDTRFVSAAATLAEHIEPLRADPSHSAVLLDVDGVLAPIVRHADDAHVPEPTRVPLIAVAKRYGLVACVSGRRATTARRIVSLGSITYVGNHGAELLRGGATEVELDPEVAAWSRRMAEWSERAWNDQLHRLRVRSEDKDVIRAFHWRGAPDEKAAEAAVRQLAEQAEEDGFVVHWGRKVLEVRPPVELNKGRGVERLLDGTDISAAVYVGDDNTDLDAFEALRRLTADGRLQTSLCVGVRSDETPRDLVDQADVLVDGPPGVRMLLSALAA